jgi:hypothetical protein
LAHLHFCRTVYKSGGAKASARITYITRDLAQVDGVANRQLRYATRADREDLVMTETRNLPAWAKGDPHVYFRAAEHYERAPNAEKKAGGKDYRGVAFEEWKITLPHELTKGQNTKLMQDLVETIAGDRLPITSAFHCPQTLDGTQQQPHLHLLISTRQTDGIARTPEQHFKRFNRVHPERGGAQKARGFARSQDVKQWRMTISDVVNLHLERVGIVERVHPDSLSDRGIDREPEPKLLPSESREYREKSKVSDTMADVLKVRGIRQQTRPKEQLNARQYWEHRKAELGITRDMELSAQRAVVCEARIQVRDKVPARGIAEGYAGIELDDRALGDRAGEIWRQAQHEGQMVWGMVQHEVDTRVLRAVGQAALQTARTEGQAVWADLSDTQRLRDVGTEAFEDAWRDAALLWAEETGARALREEGWTALQEAREEAQALLGRGVQEQVRRTHGHTSESMGAALKDLTQRLEDLDEGEGRGGAIRVRLWDRDQGLGF